MCATTKTQIIVTVTPEGADDGYETLLDILSVSERRVMLEILDKYIDRLQNATRIPDEVILSYSGINVIFEPAI